MREQRPLRFSDRKETFIVPNCHLIANVEDDPTVETGKI